MDRRQRKTREAIFGAFVELLSKKNFNRITVQEIIDLADVGRATFYSHFETKELLLKEFCKELFCHIFDAEKKEKNKHHHIFDCDSADSVFLHLFRHLQKNDNNILMLLSSQNNALFWEYFRKNLETVVEHQRSVFESRRCKGIPDAFWGNYVVSTFVTTLKWWIDNGMKESPEEITAYFLKVV